MIKSVESNLPQIEKEWSALKLKPSFTYNKFSDIATRAGVQREILDAAQINIDSFLKMQKPSVIKNSTHRVIKLPTEGLY
eukprot:330969-Rhodomonas_salina.1